MSEARLRSRGRITVPRDVRARLAMKPGDRILFLPQDDGSIRLRAANKDITALVGILPRPRRARTLREIEDSIARVAVSSALGGLRIKRKTCISAETPGPTATLGKPISRR